MNRNGAPGLLITFASLGVFASGLAAQQGNTFGSSNGWGSVLYPGVGKAPKPQPAMPPARHAAAAGKPAANRVYAYPVYVGGYGYGGGYEPAPQQSGMPPQVIQQTVNVMPDPGLAMSVNPDYRPDTARPVMREYNADSGSTYAPPPPAAQERRPTVDDERPTVYLLAFKDATVHSCLAYWVEGDTLHYVTTQYSQNRISMDLVDRELSAQLNRERNVAFKLAAPAE